ncbi:Small EDRK-rich factor 2 [Heterocephalus glaber]|uniref:Small EDRK-rich factor 2 n=1 Tax=Heterocephalus glaber TaxID=10181 RepID=G5BTT9_HETGA|nr:Small EDRK-rich factor 2 [Heterocephalus glaber]
MTLSTQRELATQKNMKKQSDSIKGKRRDDRLFCCRLQVEGLGDHAAETEKGKRGGTQVALWLRVQPSCP